MDVAFDRLPSVRRGMARALLRGRRSVEPTEASIARTARVGLVIGAGPLERYRAVCRSTAPVPLAWPQLPATALHVALLTSRGFPLPAMGLVHPRARLEQHQRLSPGDRVDLVAGIEGLRRVDNGWEFDLVARAHRGGQLVWESRAATFSRASSARGAGAPPIEVPAGDGSPVPFPADAGRSYARVSGDWNPVHLHPLLARMFGYERPIAHGWYLLARCLAALAADDADARAVDVAFARPVFLPGNPRIFTDGGRFALVDDDGKPRLGGAIG